MLESCALSSPAFAGSGRKAALAILEIVEVRMAACPRQILAAHAYERSGEVGLAGRCRFVRQDACIEYFRKPLPIRASRPEAESKPLEIYFDAQVNRNRWRDDNRPAVNI